MSAKIEYEIKRKLSYCPDRGNLIWKVNGHGIRKGRVAGGVNSDGYVQVMVCGKQMLAHRVAFFLMNGRWPKEIDHIDRNRSNNSWSNLRECSRSENQKNKNPFQKSYSTNKVGVKGVYKRPNGKYQVLGRHNKYLGTYECLGQAIKIANFSFKEAV